MESEDTPDCRLDDVSCYTNIYLWKNLAGESTVLLSPDPSRSFGTRQFLRVSDQKMNMSLFEQSDKRQHRGSSHLPTVVLEKWVASNKGWSVQSCFTHLNVNTRK